MNFKKLVKPYKKQLFISLKQLVDIPSVYDEKTKSAEKPYGENVSLCLKEFAKFGELYGFDVELDPHYVELSFGDKGPLIEVFGHLDVVPASVTNMNNPFDMKEDKHKVYGRGVSDDKGPLLAAFYAIKALKDNDLIKDCRIKIFGGGDEERGSSCLEYYVNTKKKETPSYGFTPDSGFPLIYAEKGVCTIVSNLNLKFDHIISIKGGTAPNIVIGRCTFKVDNINEIKDKINSPHEINNDEITFIGNPAHSSRPSDGKNAFLIGLMELAKIYSNDAFKDLYEKFIDYSGKKLNAFANAPILGETTYSIGLVDYKDGILKLTINCRYPEDVDPKKLRDNVIKTLNAKLIYDSYSKAFVYDKNSLLVTSLMDAYNKETHSSDLPITSSGGTYAKEVGNTVAFGAEFKGVNTKMHEEGEFANKKDLVLAMQIYARAIYNLINLKK